MKRPCAEKDAERVEKFNDFETFSSIKSIFGEGLHRLNPISEFYIVFSFSISSLFVASFTYVSASFSAQGLFIYTLSSSHSGDQERLTEGLRNLARKF